VDAFLNWSAGADPFAGDARSRALAPRTVRLRRDQIHAAVTALIETGISPKRIKSLRDLVSLENARRILRRRHEMVDGSENLFNYDLARTVVEIASRWVKVKPRLLKQLKHLASKVPAPASGLTKKNKAALRQFDDPSNLRKLFDFSRRL
jgi:integrase